MSQASLKTFFYLYTPAIINSLERWLMKKAADGWRLEEVRGWKFVFRKCQPYEAVYFAYSGFGTNRGISSDYFMSKKLYASGKSVLNKSNARIYEANINKIDSQFKYFVLLRNKYYLKHYIAMLLFALIYTTVSIFLMLTNPVHIVLLVFWIILLVYSAFAIFMLLREIRHREKS